ncbi:MAG: adenosylmethionine--8-amino-7-oxononanoate transaminase [Moraxellaceae bacterium]|nr:adenosylmethionine--8-amino-7-oxononanoate transaminase [Moraxellaceae bacterium]
MNQTDPNDDLALENINFIKTQTDIPVVQIDNNGSFKDFEKAFNDLLTPSNSPLSGENSFTNSLTFDKNHLFHPYTSMTTPLKTYHIHYAEGKYIYLADTEGGLKSKKLLEGMGSWWAVNQGYNRADLNKSAIRQINQFSHVMFGGLTHNPAIELGKTLLEILPSGLEHIFYADSGSVSVEVAIKMALQFNPSQPPFKKGRSSPPFSKGDLGGFKQKTKILTPMGGYHGDTFGAMSVCDPINGMHSLFKNMLAEQIFIPRPNCRYDEPFNEQCLEPLKQALAKHQGEIAGIIIEPLVQGAGGMWFYHADYLRYLRKICDEQDIVLIFDEIATGFGRTGGMFASDLAQVTPDIICLGKAMTGGFMSFACTVANKKIAHGISKNGNPFMHGPTFMGNPLACAVAKTAINSLQNSNWQNNVKNIEQWLIKGLEPCKKLANVADVRVLGAIGVVEMCEPVNVQALQAQFIKKGVWLRPFGKLIYTMPHFNFNQADIELICQAIYDAISQ